VMSASVIARVAMRVVGGADSYYAGFRLETCATFFLQVVRVDDMDDRAESSRCRFRK
jgi:hypothetical protein